MQITLRLARLIARFVYGMFIVVDVYVFSPRGTRRHAAPSSPSPFLPTARCLPLEQTMGLLSCGIWDQVNPFTDSLVVPPQPPRPPPTPYQATKKTYRAIAVSFILSTSRRIVVVWAVAQRMERFACGMYIPSRVCCRAPVVHLNRIL